MYAGWQIGYLACLDLEEGLFQLPLYMVRFAAACVRFFLVTQRDATQRNAARRSANATQRNATQRNATQRNAMQCNNTHT